MLRLADLVGQRIPVGVKCVEVEQHLAGGDLTPFDRPPFGAFVEERVGDLAAHPGQQRIEPRRRCGGLRIRKWRQHARNDRREDVDLFGARLFGRCDGRQWGGALGGCRYVHLDQVADSLGGAFLDGAVGDILVDFGQFLEIRRGTRRFSIIFGNEVSRLLLDRAIGGP